MTLPPLEELDQLPAATAASLLAPLFEGSAAFVARLVAARPFATDAAMIRAAAELARGLPESDQAALLNAHPRIGADPGTVSSASYAEQGYDREAVTPEWVGEELADLNEAYEQRFGFRFVVFVAGRPRAAIIPLMETALRNDRSAELARGLDEVIDIAADRLARLRADGSAANE